VIGQSIRLKPLLPSDTRRQRAGHRIKDSCHDPLIPSMDVMRRVNFPFSMPDESLIAPRKTFPDVSEGDTVPVFALQANFISGGLLLTFVGQLAAMDMTGQGHLIRLLSKACHNEPFTNEELLGGNLDRRNIVPLLDDSYEHGPEIAHQMIKPGTAPYVPISDDTNDLVPPSPPKSTWVYFSFSASSLAALKLVASKTITLASGFISTDDALRAFIWQSVTRAHLPHLSPTRETTLARAVDPRRYIGILQTYMGIVQNMMYSTYTAQKLVNEPLGAVASQLRREVDPTTSSLGYNTRALAAVLGRAAVKNNASVTASIDFTVDIALSSWVKEHCYDLDFNLGLGKAESVRRPQFVPVEGLMYLMPKALDGEIALGLCLKDEDIERLRVDEGFTKYATHIG
jgi:trichothecene 3-O-acetyltransferase